MSQRDIAEQVKVLYDVEISPELVSKISEKLMPEVTAWQNRALEAVYPFVFLDAIHYKVKENHQYVTNDDSLRKMLYLAAKNITRHWNGTCRNWDMASDYLRILFEENTAGEAVDKSN